MTPDEKILSDQSDDNQPDSAVSLPVQPPALPEQNLQAENQPPANQPIPNVGCAAGNFGVESVNVEIHIAPGNEPYIEQQFEHAAEYRAKEHRNLASSEIHRDEDEIEELSDDLAPPTNPSSFEVVGVVKEEVEESFIIKFLKRRYKVALLQLRRKVYALCYAVLSIFEGCVAVLYETNVAPDLNDVFLCFLIVTAICCLTTVLFERGRFYFLEEKLKEATASCRRRICCNRSEVQPLSKQSQYVPSGEADANFQHEVADVENANPRDLPRMVSRNQDSLESRSTDHSRVETFAVDADVHNENCEIPENSAEGACGYSPEYASGSYEYSPGSGGEGTSKDR